MLQKRELKEERFVSLSTTVAESSSNLSLNRCHTQSTFFTIDSFEITEIRDIPMAPFFNFPLPLWTFLGNSVYFFNEMFFIFM